jgi:hypothetical protein
MTTLPSAPELSARAREGFLLQHREAPASFYLQHSPSLRRLNYLFDKTGGDNQSQAAVDSPISRHLSKTKSRR